MSELQQIGQMTRYALGEPMKQWVVAEMRRAFERNEAAKERADVDTDDWDAYSEFLEATIADEHEANKARERLWRENKRKADNAKRLNARANGTAMPSTSSARVAAAFREKHGAERASVIYAMRAKGMKLREIGEEAGISTERVRQIIYKEKRRLKRRVIADFSAQVKSRAIVDASQPGDIRDEWIG